MLGNSVEICRDFQFRLKQGKNKVANKKNKELHNFMHLDGLLSPFLDNPWVRSFMKIYF